MIEFWCELASTYTYLAASRIDALAEAIGVEVQWRPFSLAPIFQASGWNTSPFLIYETKGRYMWRDVEREADALRLPWRRPSVFPRNGVPAAKIAASLGRDTPRFVRRVFHANFVEDREIAQPAVIAELLAELGLETREQPGALRHETQEAMRRGVFGAPTFSVGDELFWGNDRLERALAWAMAQR
jgi:2-hydroxychromene-2-carboxylate isomerase